MKKHILILTGGVSAEHKVALLSARGMLNHLDPERYEVTVIGITTTGAWRQIDGKALLDAAPSVETIGLPPSGDPVQVDLERRCFVNGRTGEQMHIDGCIPVLHGPWGEDGTVQGLLEILGIPYVGAKVLGSAVGMDKDVMKRLLRDAGLPITNFVVLRKEEPMGFEEVVATLGAPFYLKPANMGSSVGVHKVQDADGFMEALQDAWQYDAKLLCEAEVRGRELECAVLQTPHGWEASVVGEIVPEEYYSFDAKYVNSTSQLHIPAVLEEGVMKHIQALAKEVAQVLECRGLGRVDVFLTEQGEVLVNEINTFPGFTPISMYPALWEASGVSYATLLDRLCAQMWVS